MHSQRPRNKQQQRITANDCDVGLRCRGVPIQVRPTFIQGAGVSRYVQVQIKRRRLFRYICSLWTHPQTN